MEEEIKDVAKQIHIKLEESEIKKYAKELEEMLKEVDIINEVDTTNVIRDVSVIEQANALRQDVVGSFDKELLMQNAPEQERGLFKMPKILN